MAMLTSQGPFRNHQVSFRRFSHKKASLKQHAAYAAFSGRLQKISASNRSMGIIIYIYGSVSKPCTPVVHIKIAGKWMFIPLKMVLIGIGIDPYPYIYVYIYRYP